MFFGLKKESRVVLMALSTLRLLFKVFFFSLLSSGSLDLKNAIIWKPFALKLVEHFHLMYAKKHGSQRLLDFLCVCLCLCACVCEREHQVT